MNFVKYIMISLMVFGIVIQFSCETSAQSRKKNVPQEFDKIDTLNLENKKIDSQKSERKLAQNTKDYKSYEDFEFKSKNNDSSIEGYYQKGMASWYGRAFHGRSTASGEKFNMYKYTAAHKTIPFGSIIEITNLRNGKKIRVKINDRGPYKGKRILDMSYGAARELDLLGKGTEMVGIKILRRGGSIVKNKITDSTPGNTHVIEPVVSNLNKDETKTDIISDKSDIITTNTDSSGYSLQAGAFYAYDNAVKMKKKLESIVNGTVIIINENQMYKVRIVGISSLDTVKMIKKKLGNQEINTFRVQDKE